MNKSKNKLVAFRLNETDFENLSKVSKYLKKSVSTIIRLPLNKFVKRNLKKMGK